MIIVGTSGWQHRDWRDRFYPAGVPARAHGLGHKLGPALPQLPRSLPFDGAALDGPLAGFPPGTRVAVALRAWLDRIAVTYGERPEVFVYFNNDPGGAAVADAAALAAARGRGTPVTRTPSTKEGRGVRPR